MKAYRWTGPNSGLHLEDIAVPEPSTAEVAGKVIALGEGVSEVNIGDRVAVALTGPAGEIGLNNDGGYAEYAIVPVKYLEPIPDNFSFEQASVATDAVATSYHAVVTTGGVTASTTVAIFGLGGLGSIGLRIASLQGAIVYGFDIDSSKFEAAKRDDFVGITSTMTAALDAVKPSGRIVLTGLGDEKLALPTFSIVHKSVEIRGSLGGTKEDLRTVLALISEGKITPDLEEIPFSKVNEGLLRLEAGQTKGRLFTRPTCLSFRQESDYDVPYYVLNQIDPPWIGAIYGCENNGSRVQEIIDVECQQGRLLTFPNVFQHRVQSFSLRDPTKPGCRKILALLLLVDPAITVISTGNVPSQRAGQWLRDQGESGESLMGMVEAKGLRVELMEKRKVFVGHQDVAFRSLRFNLCAH
ncbi:hypothetical protein VE02_09084 [Pseudogymnoascus sp. 03VT05]|nr:hypothetical protein VE02_09084 [Pseudogymnoascus sp. 03VT05]